MAFQNMIPSAFGGNVFDMASTYTTYQVLDDYSNSRQQQQFFPDTCRRMSRPNNGQRASGVMRVVKPSSANTSPNSMMARRRTMDNSIAQRRQQALSQAILQQMQDTSSYFISQQDIVGQNARPVSWHPDSHVSEVQQMHSQMAPIDFSQYAMATSTPYHSNEYFTGYQNLPPTPIAYSGQTSPVSGFSPSLASYIAPATQSNVMPAYVDSDLWAPQPQTASTFTDVVEACPAYTNQESFDYYTYSPHAFDACTAPPTPDEFRVAQQTQTVLPEESISYQSLEEASNVKEEEEEEEEGEILIGMGLYDMPSKSDMDPELGHYRTTTSHLLNSTYRHGNGWKLAESWEPPASDDEDEDDADGDEEEK